jgi:hypothetical protein
MNTDKKIIKGALDTNIYDYVQLKNKINLLVVND